MLNLPPDARERLLALPGAERLRAVGNGHLHWYRRRQHGALLEVTSPAVAGLGGARDDAAVFTQCGVVEWRLNADQITTWFRAPASLDERSFSAIPEMTDRVNKLATAAPA
jgi:hypothetical protein